mgnify:CR=1 FL=1
MKKLLLFVVLFLLAITFFLPLYLGPDDLAGCASLPDATGRCEKADAIVAVSGGDTMARVDQAIELYKNGWATMLIFSGAALDKTGPSNASAMRAHAISNGVPAEAIAIEEVSETTAENATNTAKLVEGKQFKRLILVTSAYHQRRASIEFERAFGEQVTVINRPVTNDKQWSSWWWMTPYGWWLGISEAVKIVVSGLHI